LVPSSVIGEGLSASSTLTPPLTPLTIPVELILVTHRHADHTGGSARLAQLTGAPVRAADPEHCHGGGEPLRDGEVIEVNGRRIQVVATPGHTDDSVCFHLLHDEPEAEAVLTGDTILGRGTTVISPPNGNLRAYLDSLDRLSFLGHALVLPAHGPELPDLAAVCAAYLEHRHQRLDAVEAALVVLGPTATIEQVTDLVYTDIEPAVRPAAERSVAAQLEYLRGSA
jgi:glyoxylase-like metal-dependent hydrolase (beta-lactamase superfamily II)